MKFDRFEMRERYSHVREDEDGILLFDYMVKNFPRFDSEMWREKIVQNHVFVNGKNADIDHRLKKHDRVSLLEKLQEEPAANLSFKTVYLDDSLIIFEKPSDLCVHPTGPFYQNTLWFQAGKMYGELFFVGRLDRETSGLQAAVRSKKIVPALNIGYKEYIALVHGRFDKYIHANGFLVKDTASSIPKKRRFSFDRAEDSETADTELWPLKTFDNGLSLVKAILHTGRMHQIRSTLFSLGFPLVGDKLYGLDEDLYNKISTQSFTDDDRRKLIFSNQALHCSKLEFIHPVSGEKMSFESSPDWQL